MNKRQLHVRPWWLILTAATAGLILGACAPGAPTAAIDEAAPAQIDPLPSPTPTWALPDLDDEDPIVNCALEAPLCVIDIAVVEVAGEAYLGVELQALPVPDKFQPSGTDNVLLDVNVAVQRAGNTVGEINVEGYSVAIAPPEGSIILTQSDGAPLLRIDSSGLGVMLADPRPSPRVSILYVIDAGDLLLIDAQGNALATIYDGDAGVLLADPRPSPGNPVSINPSADGYLILNAKDESLVLVDLSDDTVWLLDSMGNSVAGLGLVNGLVVIAAPQGDPVAILHLEPGRGEGELIRITRLIPIARDLQGEFDLSGSVKLIGVDESGGRVSYGDSAVSLKSQAIASGKLPAPSPTSSSIGSKATPVPAKSTAKPTDSGGKLSPTPVPPKSTAKPSPTPVPPKPTTKPTDSGGKPTATPGK